MGLGGLAFALAAQDTIANLIGGFLLYLQRHFKIRDIINVGSNSRQVDKLWLLYIITIENNGTQISVHNKLMTS